MAQVIVTEGPDGGGKTTLARWLEKKHGFRYEHEGPLPSEGNLLDYYGQKLHDYLNWAGIVVMDRAWLGEMIYGPMARHTDRLGYYGMKLFQRVLASQNVSCFICLPPIEVCHRNWKQKYEAKNDYLNNEAAFYDCYHRYEGLSVYPGHRVFDYEVHQKEEVLRRDGLVFPDGVIGSPTAKFLVVGEQVNSTSMDFPFFSDHGSGRYLNDALWAAGFKEEELMFTNVKTYQGRLRDLKEVVLRLHNLETIISLGTVAAALVQVALNECLGCTNLNIQLPHPSYFKRFHASRGKDYVQQLRQIRESVK